MRYEYVHIHVSAGRIQYSPPHLFKRNTSESLNTFSSRVDSIWHSPSFGVPGNLCTSFRFRNRMRVQLKPSVLVAKLMIIMSPGAQIQEFSQRVHSAVVLSDTFSAV